MGNASTVLAAVGTLFCCWRHLPGEGARALAAAPSCGLLLLLQQDEMLLAAAGTGFGTAVPVAAVSAAWAGSALYYILLKVSLHSLLAQSRTGYL